MAPFRLLEGIREVSLMPEGGPFLVGSIEPLLKVRGFLGGVVHGIMGNFR